MSDAGCAERIRHKYAGELQTADGMLAVILGRIAADIAAQCGVGRLKAHRLARGWTVAQAVGAFHAMCRRERMRPRGLTARSWMDWEAGGRPSWDYQDLVSKLLQASPVELGWAADYSPAGAARPGRALAVSARPATATIQQASSADGRRRSLLHLPPDIRDFTGRTDQVRQMIAAATEYAQSAPPIVCLSGQAGTGKTTLAIHVAHGIGGEFPDGQLYSNLRRADSSLLDPADVLAGFLRELGVDGADIPEGIDERARMYRAQLAGTRVLVLLDDASDEAQVRPLLPGSAGCAVLVTSRSRLAALAGSHSVPLGALPADEAAGLLTAIIGDDRAAAEPDAVAEVARLCGYLPLALRIAGARLVSRPAWTVSWFASRLESRRLDLLKSGDLEVRASFALSYDGRDQAEQSAFRSAGLMASDFPAWALAAALGTDPEEAERLLEQLADAALADIVGVDATGLIRYRLHDLLRDFARELLQAEDPDSARDRLGRLAGEYTGAAELASALMHPGGPADPPGQRRLLAGDVVRGDARGWLIAERATLIELVGGAHAASLWDHAWQLAEALAALFEWRADWRSWESTHQLALDAARHSEDATAEARTLRSLGTLYRELGRYDEAVSLLTQAAGIFADRGERHHRGAAMRNLGDTYRYQGRLADAIDAFTEALTIFRGEGDTRSLAGALNGMADAYRGLSRWDESADAFRDCIAIYRDLGDRMEEARAKVRYALVFRDQHLSAQSLPLLAEGLEVARQLCDRRWEARAMRQLAIVHRNDGDADAAITTLTECLTILGELEDRRGQAIALRNRGDAHRLAGSLDGAEADLAAALRAFQSIGDPRWTARTRASIGGLCRARRQWAHARRHLEAALDGFRAIGDRPGEARSLREIGLLLRDQGDPEGSWQALDASRSTFAELGDALWAARVLASQAALAAGRGGDPESLTRQAATACRQLGIDETSVASALREW
jgi:tetratricopeptide (TPR) repeat protein